MLPPVMAAFNVISALVSVDVFPVESRILPIAVIPDAAVAVPPSIVINPSVVVRTRAAPLVKSS